MHFRWHVKRKWYLGCVAACLIVLLSQTLVAAENELASLYGAEANPTGNPLGGGVGYTNIILHGDYTVVSPEELLDALAKAKAGQVVYVMPDARIDLTGHKDIIIPGGVTLAGNRGYQGSAGPLIFCDQYDTPILLRAGAGARITGLRLQGPDPDIGPEAYFRPNSSGIAAAADKVEVDNNEIYNWSYAGVQVIGGAQDVYVHHNNIHHVRRAGLGYPVVVNVGTALIEANVFDYYRHAIASTGYIGAGYEARYNLVYGNATSHAFDMHGGGDYCPKRANQCTEEELYMAGEYLHIHHNTFLVTSQTAILLRGVPRERAEIHNNWFILSDPGRSFRFYYINGGNVRVYNNVYGQDKRLIESYIEPQKYIRQGVTPGVGRILSIPGWKGIQLRVISPSGATNRVFGTAHLEIEANIDILELDRVEVLLDGETIWSGKRLPQPDELAIDSLGLEEGTHQVTVNVVDASRLVLTKTVPFLVQNYWEQADELEPPVVSGWLGELARALFTQQSDNWVFATDTPDHFFGDGHRMLKTNAEAAYLVWSAQSLQSIAVELYSLQPQLEGVSLSVTQDGDTWTSVPYTMQVEGPSAGGWYAINLTGNVPTDMEVQSFRLTLNESVPKDALQVGGVTLKGVHRIK